MTARTEWISDVSDSSPVFHVCASNGYMLCGFYMQNHATRNRLPTANEKCRKCDDIAGKALPTRR